MAAAPRIPKLPKARSAAPDTSGGVRIPSDYTGSRNPREGTGRPGSPENPVDVPKINQAKRPPIPGSGTVTYPRPKDPEPREGYQARKAPVPGSGTVTIPKPKDPEPPFGGYRTKAGLSKVPRGLKFSGLVRL